MKLNSLVGNWVKIKDNKWVKKGKTWKLHSYYFQVKCSYCQKDCLQAKSSYLKNKIPFCDGSCRTKYYWDNMTDNEKNNRLKKVSISLKKRYKDKTKHPSFGTYCSEATKKKLRDSHLGKKFRPRTNEEKEFLRELTTKNWKNKDVRKKRLAWLKDEKRMQDLSKKISKLWKNTEFVKKQILARNVSPNKSEIKLREILQDLFPNEYKFVGDGEFFIVNKCPDFINIKGKNKVIELFGEPFHTKKEEKERIKFFDKCGYETLIIWCNELKNIKMLKEKIIKFCK